MNRREFLLGAAAAAGAGAAASGCAAGRCGAACGAPMRGFACKPMDRIRVGVVGVGARGSAAVTRLMQVPGVDVTAVCDIRDEYAQVSAAAVREATGADPLVFSGTPHEYRRLCDSGKVDVVYNATSWDAHVPVSVYAMKAGKHTMIEVPAAMTMDECWELVETAESEKRHCMQLENCCYGEYELLALNLCKLGLLGDLLHGEGAYLHDRRWQIFNDTQWNAWRRKWNVEHSGNQYSTHGLGPVALDMGINRGDRFDYLVSTDGVQRGYEEYARQTLPEGDPRRDIRFAMADMNVTTIRTVNGRTIMLQHDVTSPRPYSRLNVIAGTKGVFRSYPHLEIFLESEPPRQKDYHHRFNEERTALIRKTYRHPLHAALGDIAEKVGGHGCMDYIMDFRWVFCMLNGLPLDTDVYDLASWCAVNELSERSARNRSAAMDIPDFTRGVWKTPCRCNIMDADVDVSKIDFGTIRAAKGQLSV